ncbi:MAG: CocE/NonD family hydrolase [Myxococcota bacterium]
MKATLSTCLALTLVMSACGTDTIEPGDDDGTTVAGADVEAGAEDAARGGGVADDAGQGPSEADAGESDDVVTVPEYTGPNLDAASFKVRGTLEQVYIWDASMGAELELLDDEGAVVAAGTADDYGSLILRGLAPGTGRVVRLKDTPEDQATDVWVKSEADLAPDPELYASQTLAPGNSYITTRDGTKLHVFVSLPGPIEDGPYPTVVNYSGYSPARPGQKLSDVAEPFCGEFPVLCDVPSFGAGIFTGLMGYASVGVNMRGTGCSDGAYDYFEPLQLMDGYDIIEIVASQDWVKHGKVGMVGLSFPGIAQLFTAKAQPPSLAAITPMSVLADSASSTLAPGGIYNDGFALSWVDNVLDRARPYGHGWIQDVVDSGDALCAEHQKLHGQLVDVVQKALDNPYYTEEVAAPLDPSSWVDIIDVPVYLTGQWHDEQTGPHFAALLDKFTSSPHARFTVSNGVHVDGFSPQILMEWKTFMDFFVAREIPSIDETVVGLVPFFFAQGFGVELELSPNRFADYDDFETALSDYNAEDKLRVIWECGGLPEGPGAPAGTFETHHTEWPLPDTVATRWYFQPDGSLSTELPPEAGGASTYIHDADAATRTTLPSGDINSTDPPWDFRQMAPGSAAAFISEPLNDEVVMLGHGSIDLWFQSTATDADIEVTLTEVRDDGQEMLVQSGVLRASHRALRDDATELRPVKTHLEEDAQPLPEGEWSQVRVEMMPFGHIFRAGSRIRIAVDTPGDSSARWFFILLDLPEETTHSVAHQAAFPSSMVLPVIPSVTVETPPPACTLRGQPCRAFEGYENTLAE